MPTSPTPSERPDTSGAGPGAWNGLTRLWNLLKQLVGSFSDYKDQQDKTNQELQDSIATGNNNLNNSLGQTNESLQEAIDRIVRQGATITELADKLKEQESKMAALIHPGNIQYFMGGLGGSDGKRLVPLGSAVANEKWTLCDGSNGAPDLRGRFLVGAGGGYYINDKGGNATHEHNVSSLSTGPATLSAAQAPYHNHGVGQNGWFRSGTWLEPRSPGASNECVSTYAGNNQAHVHTGMSGVQTLAGSNLPPYYALYPFMRLS